MSAAKKAAINLPPQQPQPADEPRARARSLNEIALEGANEDPAATAHQILLKCMLGQLDERRADTQRRAALDVLAGKLASSLESATDEQLLAEVTRRGLNLAPVDLDAAEKAVTDAR